MDRSRLECTSANFPSVILDSFTSVVTPSSTSTVLSTTTVTSSTETITSTTVTPAAQTLTISTAAGFTPIATQIMSLGITDYSRKKRSAIQREDRKARRSVQSRSSVAKVLGLWSRRQSAKAIFPRFVICKKFVEGIIYSTVPSRQTSTVTAKPSTTSVTVTSTFTSTSTVAPLGVKTTTTSTAPIVTVFTTSTITQSTTTTSTSTSTAVAPAPPTQTYYPACQANNVISKIKGINLDNHGSNPGAGVQTDFSTAPSALECCHQCQDLAAISPYRCQFYIWNTANRCVIGRYDAGGSVSKPAHYYIAYSTHPSRSPETAGNGGGGIVDSVDQD